MYMPKIRIRKNTSGFIFSVLLIIAVPVNSQDTLRTFGPRIGIDLARFAYLLADPSEFGAELSVDFEVYKNLYPVAEAGYNSINLADEDFSYSSGGSYARAGVDYNLLPVSDRSIHHSIFLGARYGISRFKHQAENIVVHNSYWGDLIINEYSNNLTGHWLELTGGIKTEIFHNFFLGWTFRYKFLINNGNDDVMSPYMIPGYGKANSNRSPGISYMLLYKIPLISK
jgi:hypothetical protein